MAVIFSGAPALSTITGDTQANLKSGLLAAFLAAGWSSPATDHLLSPVNADGLQMRFKLTNVSSDLVQFILYANDGGNYQGSVKLRAGRNFQAIIMPSTFAIFSLGGNPPVGGTFVFGGCLKPPAALSSATTQAAIVNGNEYEGNTSVSAGSFRTQAGTKTGGGYNRSAWNYNGTIYQNQYDNRTGIDLWLPASAGWANAAGPCRKMMNADFLFVDPWVCVSLNGNDQTEQRLLGQLYDCFWTYESYNADETLTVGGYTFWALTHQNTGQNAGTLMLRSA